MKINKHGTCLVGISIQIIFKMFFRYFKMKKLLLLYEIYTIRIFIKQKLLFWDKVNV